MADKKIFTGVRFPADGKLHKQVRDLAHNENKSMNAVIIEFIEDGIERLKSSQPE